MFIVSKSAGQIYHFRISCVSFLAKIKKSVIFNRFFFWQLESNITSLLLSNDYKQDLYKKITSKNFFFNNLLIFHTKWSSKIDMKFTWNSNHNWQNTPLKLGLILKRTKKLEGCILFFWNPLIGLGVMTKRRLLLLMPFWQTVFLQKGQFSSRNKLLIGAALRFHFQ